ncbi:aquaporin [Thermomicrobium sp. 4228-Ro]|uniref:aquaporin n=1 Tax=Thermomicrobium sp. 4228-Ro TaxID=2993937 RepID=UPI0022488270|nr:aquaporin [Thermomicrobium sp. 4228-Ro]MCX2726458.1 aquaporin [Thermomicrobium sp. 4228-Ro]
MWGFLPAERVGGDVLAQSAGGFFGAIRVWVACWLHSDEATDPEVKRGVFCTRPAIRQWPASLFAEFLGTAVLGACVTALVRGFVEPGAAPWWVGGLMLVVGLALGGTTGFASKLACDLAPRLA